MVPVDFLDGSSVLPPLPADADPYADAMVEEEYLEEDDLEATTNVRCTPLPSSVSRLPEPHVYVFEQAPRQDRTHWHGM